MRRSVGYAISLSLTALLLASAAWAQDPAPAPPETSEKERAKQQRIDEYLRKKEERIAREEAKAAERERQKAEAAAAVEAEAAAAETAPVAAEPAAQSKKSKLPKSLARAQEAVWSSALAKDPTVRGYLELVDRQAASPQQLAAFGNFVSDGGMPHEAIEYYRTAIDLEDKDVTLWMNYGTIQRQVGDLRGAMSSYGRALSMSPNNALAHYNVGTILELQGHYDEAIEAFTLALRLDPSLGNPATNPQAANNERLVAAKLKVYQETSGRLTLPLEPVPGGELDKPAAAGEAPPD